MKPLSRFDMAHSQELRTQALDAYMHSCENATDIAVNFGVSASTLTYWAKAEDIPLRERGRKLADAPSDKALERLALLASGMTQEEVGVKTGVSKQRISVLAKRWPGILSDLERQHRQAQRGYSIPVERPAPKEAVPPTTQITPQQQRNTTMTTENHTAPTSTPEPPVTTGENPLVREIPIAEIDLKNSIQTRHAINKVKAAEYAERMQAGDQFPPAQLFDVDGVLVLTDGGHRRVAAELAGMITLLCTITKGTRQDAVLAAMAANTMHGLPRTNKDKRHAALLAIKEIPDIAGRYLADLLKVSHTFVNNLKNELATDASRSTEKRTGRDKRKRKMPSRESRESTDTSDPTGDEEREQHPADHQFGSEADQAERDESKPRTQGGATIEPPAVWPEIKQMLDERIKPLGASERDAMSVLLKSYALSLLA